MSRRGIEALLYLMDQAFRGPGIEENNHLGRILGPDDRWRHVRLGSD